MKIKRQSPMQESPFRKLFWTDQIWHDVPKCGYRRSLHREDRAYFVNAHKDEENERTVWLYLPKDTPDIETEVQMWQDLVKAGGEIEYV